MVEEALVARTFIAPEWAAGRARHGRLLELERERSRIARELHSGAGQPLAGIKMNLAFLDELGVDLPEPAMGALRRLRLLTDSALGQIRAISHGLHTPDWQAMTLEAALRRLVSECGVENVFQETSVRIAPLPEPPRQYVKIAAYRCAQECLCNAIRHSGATKVELALDHDSDGIRLRVSDNGCGMPRTRKTSGGLGLRAMLDYCADAGGTLSVTSGTHGTTMVFKFPHLEA